MWQEKKLERTSKKKWDMLWALSGSRLLGEKRVENMDKGTNRSAGDFSWLSGWFTVILPSLEITSIHRYLTSQGQLVHCGVDTWPEANHILRTGYCPLWTETVCGLANESSYDSILLVRSLKQPRRGTLPESPFFIFSVAPLSALAPLRYIPFFAHASQRESFLN